MIRTIDSLEQRVLLSGIYDQESGVLTVNGTNAGESIEVEMYYGGSGTTNQIRIRVGGASQTFTGNPLTLPKRIIVGAGSGDDIVRIFTSGDPGNSPVNYDAPGVEIFGSDGNDVITLEFGRGTSLHGGAGNDTITGGNYANVIDGGSGDDHLFGGANADTIDGGAGNDELSGGQGNDILRGGDGNDEIYANEGDDSLEGNAGNDLLRGQDGSDTLLGGAGDDILNGDRGYDYASYYDAPHYDGVHASIGDGANDGATGENDNILSSCENLIGSENNDSLYGDDYDNIILGRGGWDRIYGNGGQDRLTSAAEAVTLYGGRGNDTLIGGSMKDYLYGERGDDVLDGGQSKDYVDGGSGNNTFNEGFHSSNTGDILTLTGILRYANGIAGPDWLLQFGAINVAVGTVPADQDLLGLDVGAVQSQAQSLIGKRVRITGAAAIQTPAHDDPSRIMTITRISAA